MNTYNHRKMSKRVLHSPNYSRMENCVVCGEAHSYHTRYAHEDCWRRLTQKQKDMIQAKCDVLKDGEEIEIPLI